MAKQVQTVMGPIDVEQLGVTQAHEHLYFDCEYLYERAWPNNVFSSEKVTAQNRGEVMTDLQTVLYNPPLPRRLCPDISHAQNGFQIRYPLPSAADPNKKSDP